MTDTEFHLWADNHAATFGMTPEKHAETFVAWRKVFEAAKYTAAELAEATTFLAANNPPRWAPEHLAGINARIRDRRAVEYRKKTDVQERDRGVCTLCSGTGYVVVPHLQGVRDGNWVPVRATRSLPSYYTVAVLCRCQLGLWVGGRMSPDKLPMSIDRYERQNPRWRDQLMARHREMSASVEAAGVSVAANEVFDKLVQTLARLYEA